MIEQIESGSVPTGLRTVKPNLYGISALGQEAKPGQQLPLWLAPNKQAENERRWNAAMNDKHLQRVAYYLADPVTGQLGVTSKQQEIALVRKGMDKYLITNEATRSLGPNQRAMVITKLIDLQRHFRAMESLEYDQA